MYETELGSTANSYAIIAKLASGGMAEIFLARTESAAGVERYVVLKRVLRQRATDIKFVNMFLDEARLAAQLQHPNIAQVFDTGKLGDSYFFTMEYVHGETVRELLHRAYAVGQRLPIGIVLTIIAGAAAGLQHAHERVGIDGKPLGIVHRDVSPSNLMITYDGNVKVVDFGVAKATHRSSETQTGSVKGKIGYMSPEQCHGGNVDQRCDLFSLGIVMWELLVGKRLFKRENDYDTMEAIVVAPASPPSASRPDVPRELDAIVLRLLAKDPAERYQSATELVEALEAVALRLGVSLTQTALRRFVRELFGPRLEPWVEMRARVDASAEVVTVTGAPQIEDRDTVHALDLRLGRVVDLSVSTLAEPSAQDTSDVRPVPRRRVLRYVFAMLVLGGGLAVAMSARDDEATSIVPAYDAAVVTIASPGSAGSAGSGAGSAESIASPGSAGSAESIDVAPAPKPTPEPPPPAEPDRTTRTLAACRSHDATLARRWARDLPPVERAAIAAACAKLGTPIEPVRRSARITTSPHPLPKPEDPTPKPPRCDENDPMACRQ